MNELRYDCAIKQKKGLHFILASVLIWTAMSIVHMTSLPILTKNLLTFCCTAPLMPIAFLFSKIIRADFKNKANPLTSLGIIFSLNELIYLLIAMWVYPTVPDKLLMVIAMIFGAHLLPFGWLYKSRSYIVFSIFIPILALILGIYTKAYVLALTMVGIEIVFCLCLIIENRRLMTMYEESKTTDLP